MRYLLRNLSLFLLSIGLVYGGDKEIVEREQLCQIAIPASTQYSVVDLRPNVQRLWGGYRPTFSSLSKKIGEAEFTRVGWRSTVGYHVTVIKDGFLYFWGVDSTEMERVVLDERELALNVVKGAYLNTTFKPQRIFVKAGDHFYSKGYEGCLIAEKIISVK